MDNPISNVELKQYKELINRLKIKKEITNIKLEIEKLGVREEIEEIDLSKEKREMENRLEILQEEGDFSDLSKQYDVIRWKYEILGFKSRIQKLDEKKGSITPNVFEKLLEEYQVGLIQNSSKLKGAVESITNTQNSAQEFLSSFNEIKEEIEIRKNLNELSEEQFSTKLQQLEEQKESAESAFEITKLLLEELKIETDDS